MPSNAMVHTNCFPITQLPNRTFYQYTLAFTPADPKPDKRQRLVAALTTTVAPNLFTTLPLYDGKNLFWSTQRLNSQSFRVHDANQTAQPNAPGWFTVTLSRTQGQDINPHQTLNSKPSLQSAAAAINILQLLLSQELNKTHPNHGRSFFFNATAHALRGSAFDFVRGFYQAVRPTMRGMVVTIDVTSALMYPSGSLMDVALRVLDHKDPRRLEIRDDHSPDLAKLERFLVGRQIIVEPHNRTRVIRGLVRGPVGDYPFERDGVPTTVGRYFQEVHNRRLLHPRTIGVVISGRNASIKAVVPIETAKVKPGQFYRKKLDPITQAQMVELCTVNPGNRLRLITGGGGPNAQSPVQHYPQSQTMQDAGMVVHPDPLKVPGVFFDAPKLLFGNNQIKKPDNGAWNVRDLTLFVPKDLDNWAIVNLANRPRATDHAVEQIQRQCRALGMRCTQPRFSSTRSAYSAADIKQAIDDAIVRLDPNQPPVVVFILPDQQPDVYVRVKHYCDAVAGIISQCMVYTKADQGKPQYFANVLLKINARLGGKNSVCESNLLSSAASPVLILGADVSHPGPGSFQPSIASLVWSLDKTASRYGGAIRPQEARLETIVDLEDMVVRALREFYFYNNSAPPPNHIVFYRDGVPEGEFERTRVLEVAAVQGAYRQVIKMADVWSQGYLEKWAPKLTFIVVGKRHHHTFLPTNRDYDDGKGNVKPGLFVDEALKNPHYPDFFLQAHSAIKGTARSGHYTVLMDENFKGHIPTIAQLSFELCHSYARATRAVSIPAPVYYADLACRRLKIYINPEAGLNVDDSSSVGGGSQGPDVEAWKNAWVDISPRLSRSMPFL